MPWATCRSWGPAHCSAQTAPVVSRGGRTAEVAGREAGSSKLDRKGSQQAQPKPREIRNLTTPAKTLFPNKVTFPGPEG